MTGDSLLADISIYQLENPYQKSGNQISGNHVEELCRVPVPMRFQIHLQTG